MAPAFSPDGDGLAVGTLEPLCPVQMNPLKTSEHTKARAALSAAVAADSAAAEIEKLETAAADSPAEQN